jgi:hypothetical protein
MSFWKSAARAVAGTRNQGRKRQIIIKISEEFPSNAAKHNSLDFANVMTILVPKRLRMDLDVGSSKPTTVNSSAKSQAFHCLEKSAPAVGLRRLVFGKSKERSQTSTKFRGF